MIELNDKTQQDFLNRQWVQKLLDAGVDMNDAYYYLSINSTGDCFIIEKDRADNLKEKELAGYRIFPTYTVSELLNKLSKWIMTHTDVKNENGVIKYTGSNLEYVLKELAETFCRCASLSNGGYIKYLASLLIDCHNKDNIK